MSIHVDVGADVDCGVQCAHMQPHNAKLCPGDVATQPYAGGPCAHTKYDYSRLNDWLEKMEMPSTSTISCSWDESEKEKHAASSPPQTFQTIADTFQRYESIDDVRPPSEPGILMTEGARGDGQRVEKFIRNTIDESKVIALGWQEQSWAMSWDGIFLDRQAEEGRIWDSEIATRWRAWLAPRGKDARGQTVSLRQIYMDKHAKVLPSTPTFITTFTRHTGRAMPGAIRGKRLSSGARLGDGCSSLFFVSLSCLSSRLLFTQDIAFATCPLHACARPVAGANAHPACHAA